MAHLAALSVALHFLTVLERIQAELTGKYGLEVLEVFRKGGKVPGFAPVVSHFEVFNSSDLGAFFMHSQLLCIQAFVLIMQDEVSVLSRSVGDFVPLLDDSVIRDPLVQSSVAPFEVDIVRVSVGCFCVLGKSLHVHHTSRLRTCATLHTDERAERESAFVGAKKRISLVAFHDMPAEYRY
jgi:hypothetical protein